MGGACTGVSEQMGHAGPHSQQGRLVLLDSICGGPSGPGRKTVSKWAAPEREPGVERW